MKKMLVFLLLSFNIACKTPLYLQQAEFAQDVTQLLFFIFQSGYLCTFGEAWRSEMQALYYFHEGKGIKNSLHCKRLAIDINLFTQDGKYLSDGKQYERIGRFWESLNYLNRWGGWFTKTKNGKIFSFVDANHFERQEEI